VYLPLDRLFGSLAERQQLWKVNAGTAKLFSNGRPPWALRLPFNSQDIGTFRWQFFDRTYTDCLCARKGLGGGLLPDPYKRITTGTSVHWGEPVKATVRLK
jgi:hypothetical protein